MQQNLGDLVKLQKVHRDYLLHLHSLTPSPGGSEGPTRRP
jgi:hypothetical protein